MVSKVELVDISLLKTDGHNPNKMSDSQLTALRENITRFGFTIPIIVDENFVVADGEHRLTAARSLGMTAVPVVRLAVSEAERKIIRQVMNKLHGFHDSDLDLEDLRRILAGGSSDYLLLSGSTEKDLLVIKGLLDGVKPTLSGEAVNESRMNESLEVYLHGNNKQIVLYFPHEEYLKIISRVNNAIKHAGFDNKKDFFRFLIERYEKKNGLGK